MLCFDGACRICHILNFSLAKSLFSKNRVTHSSNTEEDETVAGLRKRAQKNKSSKFHFVSLQQTKSLHHPVSILLRRSKKYVPEIVPHHKTMSSVSLPDDVVRYICMFLGVGDIFRVSAVCQAWRLAVDQDWDRALVAEFNVQPSQIRAPVRSVVQRLWAWRLAFASARTIAASEIHTEEHLAQREEITAMGENTTISLTDLSAREYRGS
jgi:hypothetical protein